MSNEFKGSRLELIKDEFALRRQLIEFYGQHKRPYQDYQGNRLIGIGRKFETVDLSDEEIETLFYTDLARAVKSAMSMFQMWDELPIPVQHIIVQIVFHLGSRDFLMKFEKFINLIRVGRWQDAAVELLDNDVARQPDNMYRYRMHYDELSALANASLRKDVEVLESVNADLCKENAALLKARDASNARVSELEAKRNEWKARAFELEAELSEANASIKANVQASIKRGQEARDAKAAQIEADNREP